MDVNGIQANSFLGIVLIGILVGTFLITLLSFIDRRKDRKKNTDNLCQIHTDRIESIEENHAKFEMTLDNGLTRIHSRIDDIFKLLPTSTRKV
jgi:hypothetical protein